MPDANGVSPLLGGPPPPIEPPAERSYPAARRPDRSRWVDSGGLAIATYEWGDPDAPAIAAAHGGFDFAGTLDVFAPLLADAGWRVVSWDARGHGCSEHAVLYGWSGDLRDAAAVIDSIGPDPVVAMGHSKGGGVLLDLAHALPHRLTHFVNLDGMPSSNNWPDLAEHERTRMLRTELANWLGHRRRTATGVRKPGTIEQLAERRAQLNPRLDRSWLEYLVTIGGRRDDDGWRWRIDPNLRLGGFGPWRPEWSMQRVPGIGVPFLGVLGLEAEVMGWGTRPADVLPLLPPVARFVPLEGVGHFVHIEQPRVVADHVLDFLGPPAVVRRRSAPVVARAAAAPTDPHVPDPPTAPPTAPPAEASTPVTWLRHGKADLALHELRAGEGRPLLLLHGLGERSPEAVPDQVAAWPGPVVALDFCGHGASTVPRGGGYTAEMLMGDVDAAIEHLGAVTLFGRGVGAYVALLAAAARPEQVRGAVLFDGPGLAGGGTRPPSTHVIDAPGAPPRSPDPLALAELARDVRPPDYALEFVGQAREWSGLDRPIAVAARVRPEWLAAVAEAPGVATWTVEEALAHYAGVA